MSENTSSLRAGLQEAGRGKEITGHDLMDIARFCEDTRHMIVFDVIAWECPVGDKTLPSYHSIAVKPDN